VEVRAALHGVLELGNDDRLGLLLRIISLIFVRSSVLSVVAAWVGFAFHGACCHVGCLIYKFALYLSLKAGNTDLSKKKTVVPFIKQRGP
jgi:hypothetical protein